MFSERKSQSIMRFAKIMIVCILCCVGVSVQAQHSSSTSAMSQRIVIAAGTVLDGKGRVLHNVRIVIEGSKIVAVETKANANAGVDYDLRGLTVLPGWIDAHVHITWSFGADGKNQNEGAATPEAAHRAASNAWV